MNKIAYLDISPRQTGKTARLVTHANRLNASGQKVVFVTGAGVVDYLRIQMPGIVVLEDGQPLPICLNPDRLTWFYDEFDWLQSTQLREGGYYATTPRFLRKAGIHGPENDLLLRLVQANGEYFERHYWPFDIGNSLREARACYSPDEFRLMYLGEFLA